MKKIIVVLLILLSVFGVVGCAGSEGNNVVRIHIRANSNNVCDQDVKMQVKDSVVEYITPLIATCKNVNDVKEVLNINLDNIEKVADKVLELNGFDYISHASINNEYFPSRSYGEVVFPADYYDALILNLGSGKGNNWWCVAYPPLCFVGEVDETQNIKYKSKLLEMISDFFKR